MALFNGFAVTVCDRAGNTARAWSVPAATVVSDMPDDVVLAFGPTGATAWWR
jgi:xanthine dehydrogenase accessory factor